MAHNYIISKNGGEQKFKWSGVSNLEVTYGSGSEGHITATTATTSEGNDVLSGSVSGNAVSEDVTYSVTITPKVNNGGIVCLDKAVVVTQKGGSSLSYLTFVAQEDGTFAFTNAVDYSLDDGSTWTTLAANTNTPTIENGSSIMWKAELTPVNGIGTFSSSGNFIASGNPLSILFGNVFSNVTDLTGYDYAFRLLFNNCTKLTSINDLTLQATTLAEGCYAEMFFGCTSLATIPSGLLPSMTLATKCYEGMFEGCTSLTTVPSGLLKANTLPTSGYCAMFQDCTSLTTVDHAAMRATTMSESSCQDMFNGCTSLTSVSNSLFDDVTTLAYRCFYCMFLDCINLQTAPNLLTEVLAERCYEAMFQGCSRLSKIVCLATDISAYRCTRDWVYGVQTDYGRFIKASGVNWSSGDSGIPNNWTIQEQ